MGFKRWLPEGCICLHARFMGQSRIPMADCPIHGKADDEYERNRPPSYFDEMVAETFKPKTEAK